MRCEQSNIKRHLFRGDFLYIRSWKYLLFAKRRFLFDWTRSHSGARLGTRYARLFATQSFPQKLLLSQNFCVQTRTCSRPALVQKKTTFRLSLFFVLGTGLEPVRPWSQRILSPLCLPFHHPSNKGFLIIVSCNFTIALNDLSFLFFQVSKK